MCIINSKAIKITGIVQGVGFRPFVYRLAKANHLKGEVANTGSGVHILIQGNQRNIDSFCRDLVKKAPPISHITKISTHSASLKNFAQFTIIKTRGSNSNPENYLQESALIPPDISVCDECLSELFDKQNTRYNYPFINCTNCGPRYTIIQNMPYDRPCTSMKHFKMCGKCEAEYHDPDNRRFHAQPNACRFCGPRVQLYDKHKNIIQTADPIKKAATFLKQGHILALKGLGGFHISADAQNNTAVTRLRQRKHRGEKPFALMSYTIKHIEKYAHVDTDEQKLLKSLQRPIVILKKKNSALISESVSPKNSYFGVMLPYTPLHYLVLKNDFTALVMTSGNMSNQPIIFDNNEAFKELGIIADYFLIHNRDIYIRADDSILKVRSGQKTFVRRSRGYAPLPVVLKTKTLPILACGGELKNTVCITKENNAFLSQHIGDLENLSSYNFFKNIIQHIKNLLHIRPQAIAFDMHPEYLSAKYAQKQKNIIKIPVQHHHAHIVSCMAENMINTPVIGIALDGSGYGTDGNIWGSEVMIAHLHKFIRKAHLLYAPMPGGAMAIKQPWRMAISYLYNTFGEDFLSLDIPMLKQINKKDVRIIIQMILGKLNSPYTSGMGRLFDAISSITGIRNQVSFEGQAAMELEMIAQNKTMQTYECQWSSGKIRKILFQPVIKGIVNDLNKKVALSHISAKFHATIIRIFSGLCIEIRKETHINQVVLSGGVFQNSIILTGLSDLLKQQNFKLFTHKLVPANDGGLSLGQAIVADAIIKNKGVMP